MRALWGVLLLSACGVHYDRSTTRGVACADLAQTLCNKANGCSYIQSGEVGNCLSVIVAGCCGDAKVCGDPVFNPDGAATCVNRLQSDACSSIGTATMASLPGYCRQMF